VAFGLPAAAAKPGDEQLKQVSGLERLEPLAQLKGEGSQSTPRRWDVATVAKKAAEGRRNRRAARLRRTYLRLHAKVERAGEKPGRNIARLGVNEKRRVRAATNGELRRAIGELKEKLGTGVPSAVSGQLASIAACESGGNPRAVSANGLYRGKYQFSTSTWASVGGSGDPAAAPEAEQDRRAAMLLARSGPGHWPVCG
jgi:hypothetical protein